MRSGFSSPPSGSRISSAAGAPFFTSIGEREQRPHRAGNHAERRLQLAAGLLDALADLLFLLGLQQLPLADVLEIDAHEIEVLARRAGRGGHFLLGFLFGSPCLAAQRLVAFVVHDAGRRRLRGRLPATS